MAHLGSLENFTAEDWQRLAERLSQPDMAAALEYRVKNVRRGRGQVRGRSPTSRKIAKGLCLCT